MERSISIHWLPISGAHEYWLRLERSEDRHVVAQFSGPRSARVVESCRVRLPPGRYIAALLARILHGGQERWERLEREFAVDA